MSRRSRPPVLPWATVIVSAAAVLCAASTALAGPLPPASPGAQAAPVSTAGINVISPANTEASDASDLGSAGWAVQSSAIATQNGAQISTPGFNTSTWLPVTTLFPGESRTLTVTYDSSDLQGATPVISVFGWNVANIDIAALVP